MKYLFLNILFILAIVSCVPDLPGEDLDVPMDNLTDCPPDRMVYRYLLQQAAVERQRWQQDYENRKTPEQIAAYQKDLQQKVLDAIGGLPERTPLHPQITGTVLRPGYRVEKIIFQSRPNFYVTALFFLPDAARFEPPYPGVLAPCGHYLPGKGWREYQCLTDGKVMTIPGALSSYDLNEYHENELAKKRAASWAAGDQKSLLEEVRRLTGIRKLAELPKPTVKIVKTIARKGCKIEKLLICPEEGIWLPALLFLPDKPQSGRVVLRIDENGKTAGADTEGELERQCQAGDVILAVDIRGTGQTKSLDKSPYGPDYPATVFSYVLGRSMVGMRAEDVLVSARYAAERAASDREGAIELAAAGNVCIPALHAAALEPELFRSVTLRGMLTSWSSIIHNRLHSGQVVNMVHGALVHYDLPDLEKVLGDKLTIEQPTDAMGVFSEDVSTAQ